jgi:hypothetical protein
LKIIKLFFKKNSTPLLARLGSQTTPKSQTPFILFYFFVVPWPLGVARPPPRAKPFNYLFIYFCSLAFGGGRTTPMGQRVVRPPQFCPKSEPPLLLSFFFLIFFYLVFNTLFFLSFIIFNFFLFY